MTRIRIAMGLLFCGAAWLKADSSADVKAAAVAWTQAAIKQDKAALERLLTDDLGYAHSNGRIESKQQYIQAVTGGPARYESMEFQDAAVRVMGDTAVLTALIDVKIVNRDRYRVRSLQVFLRQNGQWRLTAHQSARVAGQ